MKNPLLKSLLRWLRNIILILLSLVGIFALIEAYIYVASIWGRETIVVEGMERAYRVHLPPSYSGTQPVPLVLAFHMYSGSGRTMEWLTHFDQIADKNGFIVAYPDGYKGSWADGTKQFAANNDHVNDIAFVSALIDKLSRDFSIDTTRIYATGFSNGGVLAQRLACERPDMISAVAVVGATLAKDVLPRCQPYLLTPVMMIHGTADRGIPWNGTSEEASVPETIAHWVSVNGCDNTPTIRLEPDRVQDGTRVRLESYSKCTGDAEVVIHVIENGAHAWPGGNKPIQLWGLAGKISENMDASVAIWEFFQNHQR
jgi:polyhydroxybutyrate depolymerase